MEAAVNLFRATFDAEPEGVWAAPGRVNLIGEHTDYNGGAVLPIALPLRTVAAARRRGDRMLRLVSDAVDDVCTIDLDDVAPGRPEGWGRYPAGVPWALEAAGLRTGGMDVAFTSTVPIGAGLSSSAAIEGAMAAAASDLFGLGLLADDASRAWLAETCRRAENEIALAPTGGMDQAVAMRARAGHALLIDFGDGTARHLPFAPEDRGLAILVIDTRVTHALDDGAYGSRRAECERAAAALGVATLGEVSRKDLGRPAALEPPEIGRRVHHVVTEIDRVARAVAALERDDLRALGPLLDASHASLRDDFEVSCPELDTACRTAVDAGALGARMTGGGFGGSAIALVETGAADQVAEAVAAAFASEGFAPPTIFPATAADGAMRIG